MNINYVIDAYDLLGSMHSFQKFISIYEIQTSPLGFSKTPSVSNYLENFKKSLCLN
jgi:hypothetical protein